MHINIWSRRCIINMSLWWFGTRVWPSPKTGYLCYIVSWSPNCPIIDPINQNAVPPHKTHYQLVHHIPYACGSDRRYSLIRLILIHLRTQYIPLPPSTSYTYQRIWKQHPKNWVQTRLRSMGSGGPETMFCDESPISPVPSSSHGWRHPWLWGAILLPPALSLSEQSSVCSYILISVVSPAVSLGYLSMSRFSNIHIYIDFALIVMCVVLVLAAAAWRLTCCLHKSSMCISDVLTRAQSLLYSVLICTSLIRKLLNDNTACVLIDGASLARLLMSVNFKNIGYLYLYIEVCAQT